METDPPALEPEQVRAHPICVGRLMARDPNITPEDIREAGNFAGYAGSAAIVGTCVAGDSKFHITDGKLHCDKGSC